MTGYFAQMARNNAWANGVLGAAVCSLPGTDAWLTRPGFFGSIGGTLNHIRTVDLYYLDALEQRGPGPRVQDRQDIGDMDLLQAAQRRLDQRLIGFCDGLTRDALCRPVATQRATGTVMERVDRILLHLFQHDIHHRGQVHGMLSHAGIDPPQLDDFYLEFGRVPSAQAYWEV